MNRVSRPSAHRGRNALAAFVVLGLALAVAAPWTGRSARAASAPSSRGDQLVFYYDARDGRTSFLNLRNLDPQPTTVGLVFYSADLSEVSGQTLSLPARGLRTIDVGALRAGGLPAGVGIAVATGVNASAEAVVTKALSGSFTVANLATGSAWGAPAVRRRARLVEPGPDGDDGASRGSVIDGTTVALEPVEAGTANLANYYDPETLRPAAEGGNELVIFSFADAPGRVAGIASGASRWLATARRRSGVSLSPRTLDVSGVRLTDLVSVFGADVNGSAGSLELELDLAASPIEGVHRVVFFAEALGTFGTGYRLPARAPAAPGPSPSPSATPATTPTAASSPGPTGTPQPIATVGGALAATPAPAQGSSVRADQVIAYYDAREGATTYVNLRNHDDNSMRVRLVLASADLASMASELMDLPASGTATIDVAALVATKGLPRTPGLLFASRVNQATECLVSGRISGSFTVANLATGSAWGAPAMLRTAYRATGTGPVRTGDVIDGEQIALRVIDDGELDLAAYYDPATLAPAESGGHQLALLAFRDGTLPVYAPAPATVTWQVVQARADGTAPTGTLSVPVTGLQLTDLVTLLGPTAPGSSGSLLFQPVAPRQDDASRAVFFAEALGTFGTGYRLPALR